MKYWITLGLTAALLFLSSSIGTAGPIFFSNETAWRDAAIGEVDFAFTAANVALANEVGAMPGRNTNVGSPLTFQAVNTGLPVDFVLSTLQPSSAFTFDDDEEGGNLPTFDNALSVGDIDNFEDDDWEATFSSGVFAFGFDLRNNDGPPDSFSVFGAGDSLLGVFNAVPISSGSVFVGVVSDIAIHRVVFDEDSGDDDIAIGALSFSAQSPVPEPSSLTLLATATIFGLLAIYPRRRHLVS